jgi:hypothetical protein
MKVRTRTAIFQQTGDTIPACVVIDVPEDVAADWLTRGIAEPAVAAPEVKPEAAPGPPAPPVPEAPKPARSHHAAKPAHPKGKR